MRPRLSRTTLVRHCERQRGNLPAEQFAVVSMNDDWLNATRWIAAQRSQ